MQFLRTETSEEKTALQNWLVKNKQSTQDKYSTKLYNDNGNGVSSIDEILPSYSEEKTVVDAIIVNPER